MSSIVLRARRAAAIVVSTAVVGVGSVPLAAPAAAAETARFDCVGAPQTYAVPSGVSALDVVLAGASGGTDPLYAGPGGLVSSRINVTAGTVLTVVVGCRDGYNGGGDAPFNDNGGGASDVRLHGATLAHRVLVAGGGGGPGREQLHSPASVGGAGGFVGTRGGDGLDPDGSPISAGGGGTQTQGGTHGAMPTPLCPMSRWSGSGSLGSGGAGAQAWGWNAGFGGGGGGGYYGGGGGAAGCVAGAGGGGGSSYGPPESVFTVGGNTGDGYVEITPAPAGTATTLSPSLASDDCAGGPVVINATDGLGEGFGYTDVRAATVQPDSSTRWLCVRTENPAFRFGGKFVITTAPGGIGGTPHVDNDDAACGAAAGNTAPGPHPLLSGAVGDPSDPTTYTPYLLDTYAGPAGTWVCLRAGAARYRVVIPGVSATAPAAVAFVADPPGRYPVAWSPAPARPSSTCLASPFAQGADVRLDGVRAFALRRNLAFCVRVDAVVGAGGVVHVTIDDPTLLVPETSTTDMSPCTVQIARNDNPAVSIRRSPDGAPRASICLSVGGESFRLTMGSADGTPVGTSWEPDPGTPGLP